MTVIFEFAIVGVVISLIMQGLKYKFGMDSWKSKLSVVVLSLIVGYGYVLFKETPFWETSVTALASASTVYALIMKDLMK